ncbi:OsmC family protein [Dokdonia sp.]|uniref:OsmC family protein n=1 Tax=Dokdonia sp. TaxID=2024995 RepID=UPI003267B142
MSQENQHVETFKATAQGNGWPTTINITDTEWVLQTDEPTEEGGTNSGANPMQYFAASLAGCQNEQAQVVAEELGITINKIDITLEIDMDLSSFMGVTDTSEKSYKEVRFKATVHGDVTQEQVKELGNKVDNRCPILGLLRSGGCNIVSTWSI